MRQNQGNVLPLHFVCANVPIRADSESRRRAWFHIKRSLFLEQSGGAAIILDFRGGNDIDVAAHECWINAELQRGRSENDYLPWPVRGERCNEPVDQAASGCL